MLPPPSRSRRRVTDALIMVCLVIFGYILYPLTTGYLFNMMPKQVMLVTETETVNGYLSQYTFEVNGRIEYVYGYSQHFQNALGIPEGASVDLIHAKVSEFHKQYEGVAVCRHFAPLLFVMLTKHGYIAGTRLKIGYVEAQSMSIRTIEGKTFAEPNHMWVEINGTVYESKGLSIPFGPLAKFTGKTYVEWGAQKIENTLTFWYFIVADLKLVTK